MKWKVFIMCHNVIWEDMYTGDANFSSKNYTFFKLGDAKLEHRMGSKFTLLNEYDLPIHMTEAHYAELTGLYAIYKNGLHKGLDAIGFSQYDKEHRLIGSSQDIEAETLETLRLEAEKQKKATGPTDVTTRIEKSLNDNPTGVHICLEGHGFQKMYDSKVMMDESDPDAFVGEGINCFDAILSDYNSHFGTSFTMSDVAADGYLTMCDSFITPVLTFEKLMEFLVPIIESRRLDIFDSKRKHRLQGGLLERYVAVFFALEKIKKIDMSTFHQYWRKKNSRRIKRILEWLNLSRS